MDTILILGIAILAIITGSLCGYLFSRTRTATAEALLAAKNNELDKTATELDALRDEVETIRSAKTELERDNARLQERLKQESEERENIRKDSESAFRQIAATIIDERTKTFKEANETRLMEILRPFKDNMDSLQKTIHDCYTGEAADVKSLKDSLQMLKELNEGIGREAKELSGALRGNSKVQGDWGEMILQQVLESSGLEEGVNYKMQATRNTDGSRIVGEEGNSLRPDALFYLPDGRSIVIDSKVSLTAYTEYVNSTDEQMREKAKKEHLASVRKHIDELSDKHYDDFVSNTADFVMMFIPNECAYMATMQADPNIWEDAYKKRIVLVSPTHLLSVLKLMYQLWSREKQTKNALKIAEETGKLYDKLAGFVADLDGIGAALKRASKTYEDAYSKFSSGKGNILSRAENIRQLGIKTTKSLPTSQTDE